MACEYTVDSSFPINSCKVWEKKISTTCLGVKPRVSVSYLSLHLSVFKSCIHAKRFLPFSPPPSRCPTFSSVPPRSPMQFFRRGRKNRCDAGKELALNSLEEEEERETLLLTDVPSRE